MPVVQRSRDRVSWSQLLLPWEIVGALRHHGALLSNLPREVLARYRGSYLGVFWSLMRPLAMLTVYVVVFGFILQPQLGGDAGSNKLEFVLSLFCGLVLFDFFAEVVGRKGAPFFRVNYVTKVVFPLEILSQVAAALLQMVVSFVPFFAGVVLVRGAVPATVLFLPLVVAPLILFALGFSWLLSSLGVFVRDLNAAVPLMLVVLLFASAIFYSVSSVPPEFRTFFQLNPLAVLVDEARSTALLGRAPAWGRLAAVFAASIVVAIAGYAFFMRSKRGFADVIWRASTSSRGERWTGPPSPRPPESPGPPARRAARIGGVEVAGAAALEVRQRVGPTLPSRDAMVDTCCLCRAPDRQAALAVGCLRQLDGAQPAPLGRVVVAIVATRIRCPRPVVALVLLGLMAYATRPPCLAHQLRASRVAARAGG